MDHSVVMTWHKMGFSCPHAIDLRLCDILFVCEMKLSRAKCCASIYWQQRGLEWTE